MTENTKNSEKVIQYLFGELSLTELATMEEGLFSDEEFSFYLDAVEYDLIDGYVRGEMDFASRQRFEKKYLTSERRRKKVIMANILQQNFLQ